MKKIVIQYPVNKRYVQKAITLDRKYWAKIKKQYIKTNKPVILQETEE